MEMNTKLKTFQNSPAYRGYTVIETKLGLVRLLS